MGNLSFHSQHKDGTYADHTGSGLVAASHHDDISIHHLTHSFAGGQFADAADSQHGMDATIYQISESGVPLKVFGVDMLPSDGVTNGLASDEGGSVNGRYGGWGVRAKPPAQTRERTEASGAWARNRLTPLPHTPSRAVGRCSTRSTASTPSRARWRRAARSWAR